MANTNANMKQLGTSGLRRWGGYVYEEFIPELRWPRAGEVYREMSTNDPVIGSILYAAEMLIRTANWCAEPAGDKPVDIEAAEFLKSCMDDMSVSWADTICEILSMLTYGFSFHEIVYKIRRGPLESSSKYRSKFTDGRIGWRRIPTRAQNSLLRWDFDDDGDMKTFVQLAPPDYKVIEIPLKRGLLFRTKVSLDNPEGKSLLRNAYRPWYFKKRLEEIEGIGVERDLVGLPTLTAPEGMDLWNEDDPKMKTLRANAEALVQSVRRDSEEGILLPAGWEMKLLSTGSSRQFDTNSIINRYDNRIAITMLSDLVLIGGDKTGSFALADTKQSLLGSALAAQVQNIADVFNNYAIPTLFNMNNFEGMTDYPRIVPGKIQVPGIKELALLLRSMGLNISKDIELMNYLRKISNMPQLDQETFDKVYASQGDQPITPTGNNKGDDIDDTAQNDLEQNDLNYI